MTNPLTNQRPFHDATKVLHLLIVVLGLLTVNCTSSLCRPITGGDSAAFVKYQSKGPVGIIQELHYQENGMIRLEAANGKVYCRAIEPDLRNELDELLQDENLLSDFGEYLRYPECYLQEELTVGIPGQRVTARIDALNGRLLSLIELLEDISRDQFGKKYMISIVERATQQQCETSLPSNEVPQTPPAK